MAATTPQHVQRLEAAAQHNVCLQTAEDELARCTQQLNGIRKRYAQAVSSQSHQNLEPHYVLLETFYAKRIKYLEHAATTAAKDNACDTPDKPDTVDAARRIKADLGTADAAGAASPGQALAMQHSMFAAQCAVDGLLPDGSARRPQTPLEHPQQSRALPEHILRVVLQRQQQSQQQSNSLRKRSQSRRLQVEAPLSERSSLDSSNPAILRAAPASVPQTKSSNDASTAVSAGAVQCLVRYDFIRHDGIRIDSRTCGGKPSTSPRTQKVKFK